MITQNMLSRTGISRVRIGRRKVMSVFTILLWVGSFPSVIAAEEEWLYLQTPEFSVVSQLDERKTRRWAGEFDQFVSALFSLYAIERKGLPPLTIVLFDKTRNFAPYRPRTESGQANNVGGVFGRQANWSVMGSPEKSQSRETRRVLNHEAVHWFFSASGIKLPLWFNEGYAEVLSTIEVRDGVAQWGRAIPGHVQLLRDQGLRPLREFFELGQDEALHGDSRYYPQAWAFVHFAVFGGTGAHQKSLSELARRVRLEPVDVAFKSAFGMSLEEGDQALRTYIKRGTYSMARLDMEDRVDGFVTMQATPIQVQSALGRLALVTRNTELAKHHAAVLIEGYPTAPEGFELRATASLSGSSPEAGRQDVLQAVKLDSQDAGMHLSAARFELNDRMETMASLDQALDPQEARQIADRVIRALELRSTEPMAFEMFSIALLNVRELTSTDEGLLDVMQRFMPQSGLPALVRSVSAYRRGDYFEARELLELALSQERELPARLHSAARSMGERWLYDKLAEAFNGVENTTDFDAAYTDLEAAMATPGLSASLRAALESMSRQVVAWRARLPEGAPYRQVNQPSLHDYWQSILDDPQASEEERANAKRALEKLAR